MRNVPQLTSGSALKYQILADDSTLGSLLQLRSAARLAPKDALPFSNLSAVKFELGDYAGCILFSQKALTLLEEQAPEDGNPLREKIYLRLAKAYFYSLRLENSNAVLSSVISEDSRADLSSSISRTIRLRNSYRDEGEFWRLILDRVPRYKPCL